ncbi:MAG: magnesium transporter [Actinobacteria bacterium]|nr:magnesium transporter [Actinomycetota bacterium]
MAGDSAASAADHATLAVPTASPGQSAGEVRDALAGRRFESVASVAVLDDDTLIGLVPMEKLLAAPPGERVTSLAVDEIQPVPGDASQELAASRAAEAGGRSVPVLAPDGSFVGLIPPERMLGVLAEEHEEDLARFGGLTAGTGRARRAARESVPERLRHRLPWLLLGLVGAMASAILVGSFEETLDRVVLVAFFVPAVVYMADAVGTQTEAILIRGLSVGVTVREVVRRELLTGAITGILVGLAFLPFVWIGWGDVSVAIAVALALVASCSIATAVAMVLPWCFQRLGRDPAFGSGPLATVIQDLLSIAVYLAIAVPLAD